VLTAGTRLACLLGHPVAHSVSPQIHNAAFAAAGVDAVYVAFDVPPPALPGAVRALGELGALGANVTVPHKRAAWELADERSREAEVVGAANTLSWRDGRLVADNTDAPGLQAVLARIGLQRGEDAVIVGAGGAARAVAVALGRLGARVTVEARRPQAAAEVEALARVCGAAAGPPASAVPRLVVNATPLGLHGERLPDRHMSLGRGQVAFDLLYGRAATPFLASARAGGAVAVDGLGLLVAQAALSFERWTGLAAPLEAMHLAAADAIGRPPLR
jgi:shikimate dehydrogenase